MKRIVTASEFEAQCLEIFDEVAATGQEIVVTKSGKPVAMVLPVEPGKTSGLTGVASSPAGSPARP